MDKKIALFLKTGDPLAAAADWADKLKLAEHMIDSRANKERRKLVPDGLAAAVYQVKASEADSHEAVARASGTPVAGDYPHLRAEIGVTAENLAGVAAAVRAKRDYYLAVASPAIEGTRKTAKAAAAAAAAAEDMAALRAAVATPMTPPPEA